MKFLSRLYGWASEADFVWKWIFCWALVVGFACWAFPDHWIHRDTVDRIKWCGMIFQLGGIFNAVQALDRSRADFGLEPFTKTAFSWFDRLRRVFFPQNLTASVGTAAGSARVFGASLRVGPPNTNADQRLAFLEREVAELRDHLNRELARIQREHEEQIARERAERSERLGQLGNQIREGFVGGWRLAVYGATNILVGTVLTAIPEDIAKFLVLARLANAA